MKLEGLHHITMITGDAQRNVDFYADVLGLRLVKKTVNFDAPDAYHLYFGDEQGAPGSILTWFEFAGARPGPRRASGMIHTLQLGVAVRRRARLLGRSASRRTARRARGERSLRFADPDGLALELVVADDGNPPLRAEHPEIPAEHAIIGLEGARAYGAFARRRGAAAHRRRSASPTSATASTALDGDERHFHWAYDAPPARPRPPGRGHRPPHRVGLARRGPPRAGRSASRDGRRLRDRRPRPRLLPRRSTSASRAASCSRSRRSRPGFAVDEDPEHLGEALRLPKQHEHLRDAARARRCTPLVNPRAARRAR